MPSAKITGQVQIQLSAGAAPAARPINFSMEYGKSNLHDFNYNAAQATEEVPRGEISNVRLAMVWVESGSIELSWDSGGDNPTVITANASPPPTEPGLMLFARYGVNSGVLHITTQGPAKGSIYLFE